MTGNEWKERDGKGRKGKSRKKVGREGYDLSCKGRLQRNPVKEDMNMIRDIIMRFV